MAKKQPLSPLDRDILRAKRKAERLNKKQAEALPLFQGVIPKATAEGEYWHWRRQRAMHGESGIGSSPVEGLLILQGQRLRRLAQDFVTLQILAKLDRHRWHTYPNNGEWSIHFWAGVLLGKQTVLSLKKLPANNTVGFVVLNDEVFKLDPAPFTYEALAASHLSGRWEGLDRPSMPDDNGLMELLDDVIARNKKGG